MDQFLYSVMYVAGMLPLLIVKETNVPSHTGTIWGLGNEPSSSDPVS